MTWASLVAQIVKNLPAMQETQLESLGLNDPLEKGTATQSSLLAWRIPRTEEPGGLQSVVLQSDMTERRAAEAMTCLVFPVSEFYVNQRGLYESSVTCFFLSSSCLWASPLLSLCWRCVPFLCCVIISSRHDCTDADLPTFFCWWIDVLLPGFCYQWHLFTFLLVHL